MILGMLERHLVNNSEAIGLYLGIIGYHLVNNSINIILKGLTTRNTTHNLLNIVNAFAAIKETFYLMDVSLMQFIFLSKQCEPLGSWFVKNIY